jgi:hypothetical protein
MSEIRVDTISEKTSGSGTTVSNLKNPKTLGRNLVINGDFQFWQRGTSAATVTGSASSGTYLADRFAVWENTDGTITQEQEALSNADVITTGMRNALLVKCTGTDSSIGADQFSAITHKVEAQSCQGLQYGTSNAKNLTLSFFVKSNITGIHNITLRKEDSTAYYLPKEYTINSADTWEKKTITFGSGDTNFNLIQASGGNIVNDNGTGIFLHWGLANGSNLQGTANTWTSSVIVGTSNQQNFLSSTSNEFYLTGVQLEIGDTATDFEHLPYDVQFQRCQRYFQTYVDPPLRGVINATNSVGRAAMILPVCMRDTPAASVGNHGLFDGSSASFLNAVTTSYLNSKAVEFDMTCSNSVMVVGRAGIIFNGGTATFTLDAEL